MTNDTALSRLRARLTHRLASADREAFIGMLWALNALQTGRSEHAANFFHGIPDGAATKGLIGPAAIYPWELETLGNELLTSPEAMFKSFDSRRWSFIADAVNMLRSLEGREYSVRGNELNIMQEMGRIGARQFEWQRNTPNPADFHRSAVIYGQGECAKYLARDNGLTVAEMTLVGFALMAAFQEEPVLRPGTDLQSLHQMGIAPDKLALVLGRISRPLSVVAAAAIEMRRSGPAAAYKPSVFRRFPCITMGPGRRRMRAPLPDLIVSRVTSGLYYDVIGGGGPVRDDYGRRFEGYVHRLLEVTLPEISFEREWWYRVSGTRFDTPDVIASTATGHVRLVIECKAAKMGMAARFGEDPSEERGYEQMAKGVAQIWRFFSHCRRRRTGRDVAPEATGLILTLDDWFIARSSMIELVLQRAAIIADAMDAQITYEDRRPVGFASVMELESVLRTATPQSFLATADLATTVERRGWMFPLLHQQVDAPKVEHRPYPFEDQIEELLPWWAIFRPNDRFEEQEAIERGRSPDQG